ncbi:hypothetical protein JMJ35_007088 [Cladonia borealis]|uniref:Uncharacterized protein n=1 Tax=Cladonia borealis TaxID=184061 RepID=A0AA39U8R6_9LECA|nr:hypothetical protein JMJ35_007088 [Cladonia borealis]
MDEDDRDQAPPISDLPTNGLDFDDFHSNPLTFRDALSAHELPRLSQTLTSIVPDPSDSDTDSENTTDDYANFVFETSSHDAGGSEVGGAAGNGTGSGVPSTNGFASHGVDVDQSDDSEKEMEGEGTQPLT